MTVWVTRSCCRARLMTGAAERLATTANYSWCLNGVSSASRGAGHTVPNAPYHPTGYRPQNGFPFWCSSILWCSLTHDRQEVRLCFNTNKGFFLQRLSKQSRIHLSLIWLIKPALPLIIFYHFLQAAWWNQWGRGAESASQVLSMVMMSYLCSHFPVSGSSAERETLVVACAWTTSCPGIRYWSSCHEATVQQLKLKKKVQDCLEKLFVLLPVPKLQMLQLHIIPASAAGADWSRSAPSSRPGRKYLQMTTAAWDF